MTRKTTIGAIFALSVWMLACPGDLHAEENIWVADSLWNSYYMDGMVAYADGKLIQAVGYMEAAVRRAETLAGEDRLIWSLEKLVIIYRAREMTAEADGVLARLRTFPSYRERVEKKEKVVEQRRDRRQVFKSLCDSGTTAWSQGHYAESEDCFLRALYLADSIPTLDVRQRTRVLYTLGLLSLTQEKPAQAELFFLNRLTVAMQDTVYSDLSVETMIEELAGFYRRLGMTGDWLHTAQLFDSLRVTPEWRHEPGIGRLLWAFWYETAYRIRYRGRPVEAEYCLNRSLAVMDAVPRDDVRFARSGTLQADLLCMHGATDSAAVLLSESEEVIASSPEATDFDRFHYRRVLALLRMLQGRLPEAESLYVVLLSERALSADSLQEEDLEVRIHLAEVRTTQGRPDEAESLYRASLQLADSALGPGHPATADAAFHFAGFLADQGRDAESERLYLHAITISDLNKSDPALHHTYLKDYAGFLHNQGRDREAADIEARMQAVEDRNDRLRPW